MSKECLFLSLTLLSAASLSADEQQPQDSSYFFNWNENPSDPSKPANAVAPNPDDQFVRNATEEEMLRYAPGQGRDKD